MSREPFPKNFGIKEVSKKEMKKKRGGENGRGGVNAVWCWRNNGGDQKPPWYGTMGKKGVKERGGGGEGG